MFLLFLCLSLNNSLNKAAWHDQVKENSGQEAQPSHPALFSVPKLGEEDTAGERNRETAGTIRLHRQTCYCASQMVLSLLQTESKILPLPQWSGTQPPKSPRSACT